jgi:acetyl esterase/lipase
MINLKFYPVRLLKSIFILSVFLVSSVSAQKNRYGMALSGSPGNYTLTDASKICPLIPGGCETLPADAFEVFPGYQPELISDNDYAHCTTLKYTFKIYDTHSLNLEVDIPKLTTGPHPFIIWVHGGGWSNGGTSAFVNQSTYLASRGIAGVRITYSVISQGGDFNQGMQELADAFSFVQAHAAEWGLDMTRFGYAGGSAGTPLSSLAAMKHNGNGCKLYMGCNGIYDFQNNLAGAFGSGSSPYLVDYPSRESRGVISAINYIPENMENIPAVAVFHGTADFTISHLQSVTLCDSVISKGGRAEKNIYDYYVHAFFNRGTSDMFEDVTLKMYAFAKSVFGMPDVTLPPPATDKVIVRFPFTTGENQTKAADVVKGIHVSDMEIGMNITGTYNNNKLETYGWDGFNIGAHRYIGFKITNFPQHRYTVSKIGLKVKKSTAAQAVNGVFNYGPTLPTFETKGVVSNGIATDTEYSNAFLMPNAGTPAFTNDYLCFAVGIATKDSKTEVVYIDELIVYGDIERPVFSGPTLYADKDSVLFDTNQGESLSAQVTLYGELLENTIQVSITGDGASKFTINRDYATVSELEYGKTLEVNFSGTDAGVYVADLLFESDELSFVIPMKAIAIGASGVDAIQNGKLWVTDRTLYVTGFQQASLLVYDLSGQLIQQHKQLPANYQCHDLDPGIYIVKIITGNENTVKKVFVG